MTDEEKRYSDFKEAAFSRAWFLVCLLWKGRVRRWTFDIYRELTIALCGIVILGLFSYLFSDFINEKIGTISSSLRQMSTDIFLGLVSVVVGGMMGRWVASIENSILEWASLWGESYSVMVVAQRMWVWSTVGLIYFIVVGAVHFWFFLQSIDFLKMLFLSFMTFFVVKGFTSRKTMLSNDRNQSLVLYWAEMTKNRLIILVGWRIHQMVKGNPLIRGILVVVFLLTVAYWIFVHPSMPEILSYLIALNLGFFASIPLHLQLKEDLISAWTERNMGVSHHDIFLSFQIIGVLLGAFLSALTILGTLVHASGLSWIKLVGLTSLSSAITPSFLFQIDPRKPILQMIVVFLVSLFLGTGMIMSSLSIVGVPLLIYYAAKYQEGSFYRA